MVQRHMPAGALSWSKNGPELGNARNRGRAEDTVDRKVLPSLSRALSC